MEINLLYVQNAITLANKEKTPEQQLPVLDSTNYTVYVSGLRFSWKQNFFTKSCFEVPKIINFSFFLNLSDGKLQVNDRHLRCILGQINHIYAKKELSNLIL